MFQITWDNFRNRLSSSRKSSKQDPNLEILLELEDDEPRWGETQATSAVGAPAPPNVQHAHGFTRVGTKNYLDGTRELGILKRDGATGHASEDISHIFRIDPDTLYHPYAENSKYSHCTKAYVGNGAVEPLRWLPIEASKRNAELFHFCEHPLDVLPAFLISFSPTKVVSVYIID